MHQRLDSVHCCAQEPGCKPFQVRRRIRVRIQNPTAVTFPNLPWIYLTSMSRDHNPVYGLFGWLVNPIYLVESVLEPENHRVGVNI